MTVSGLILDGGGGRRMGGVRKGGLRLGNLPLVHHVAARLGPRCDALLYSYSGGPVPAGLPDDAIPLPDVSEGPKGPVAALYAAAQWCKSKPTHTLLMSVSVDTPFVPADFAKRAKNLLTPTIGCVTAGYRDRNYPTVALWRLATLGPAMDTTDRGSKGPRLRDIQNRLGVATLDYTHTDPQNPFAGANALSELLELQKRLDADNAPKSGL